MAGAPLLVSASASAPPVTRGHPVWRRLLIAGTVVFLTIFIVLPVVNVFTQALSKGVAAYTEVFTGPAADQPPRNLAEKRKLSTRRAQSEKTASAIAMSVGVAAVVVPLNILFGLMAAWAVTKFRFRGRLLLIALIDLPFSVSPVVAGLIFVLLLGRTGLFGAWATNFVWPDPTSIAWRGFGGGWPIGFDRFNSGIIFTPLAIVLASVFVTFPFVARSVIPLMQAQGTDEEVAALSLGASGWRTFRFVTLPNIRWALLYGTILCTARAFGEFGAVSVVSGNTDANDTMPLRIEKLWNEYDNQAAFTVASLLALLAMVTLVLKTLIDWRAARSARRDTGATLQAGPPS
ncbi:sulfate ABC transporter permease [Lichenifustis flavocetrariae]|uniref:ABC transporter permease subunit n=1 Tax=Lichenifustis flavocetrariae TaxID=2949735 RepID=A0AA41Z555_9HYPH|nr:ABC transporter permease subunit [Lichenifustis flavocetrariae]MCW6510480.1 ABC transporter permease subunit [Lichenifustis flavocetrariae]